MPVPLQRAAEARGAPAADEEGEEQRGRNVVAVAAVGGEGEGGDAGCWTLKHD